MGEGPVLFSAIKHTHWVPTVRDLVFTFASTTIALPTSFNLSTVVDSHHLLQKERKSSLRIPHSRPHFRIARLGITLASRPHFPAASASCLTMCARRAASKAVCLQWMAQSRAEKPLLSLRCTFAPVMYVRLELEVELADEREDHVSRIVLYLSLLPWMAVDFHCRSTLCIVTLSAAARQRLRTLSSWSSLG